MHPREMDPEGGTLPRNSRDIKTCFLLYAPWPSCVLWHWATYVVYLFFRVLFTSGPSGPKYGVSKSISPVVLYYSRRTTVPSAPVVGLSSFFFSRHIVPLALYCTGSRGEERESSNIFIAPPSSWEGKREISYFSERPVKKKKKFSFLETRVVGQLL